MLVFFLSMLTLVGLALIILGINDLVIKKRMNNIIKKETAEAETKKRETNRKIQENTFEFPAEKFYRLCSSNNISCLDNEYSIQKATQTARDLMKATAGIEIQDYGNYLDKDRLERFLVEGKQKAQDADEEKIREQKTPRVAEATESERTFLKRSAELAKLYGKEKRVEMLYSTYNDYQKKIDALRKGEEALKTLGMIYADQQKKQGDWAIMGGIAEGIAGVGAGVAVAASTMAKNAEIRKYNEDMRKASVEMMSGLPTMAGDRYALENESSKIWQRIDETKNKVVLSEPTADKIWDNITIGKPSVKKNDSGVLAIAVPLQFKHPFDLNVPDGVGMVVDGTLEAQVWFEDTLVDTIYIPFPVYGIPCNMMEKITLDGMCGQCVAYKGSTYKVKFKDEQNLWVMEA